MKRLVFVTTSHIDVILMTSQRPETPEFSRGLIGHGKRGKPIWYFERLCWRRARHVPLPVRAAGLRGSNAEGIREPHQHSNDGPDGAGL